MPKDDVKKMSKIVSAKSAKVGRLRAVMNAHKGKRGC